MSIFGPLRLTRSLDPTVLIGRRAFARSRPALRSPFLETPLLPFLLITPPGEHCHAPPSHSISSPTLLIGRRAFVRFRPTLPPLIPGNPPLPFLLIVLLGEYSRASPSHMISSSRVSDWSECDFPLSIRYTLSLKTCLLPPSPTRLTHPIARPRPAIPACVVSRSHVHDWATSVHPFLTCPRTARHFSALLTVLPRFDHVALLFAQLSRSPMKIIYHTHPRIPLSHVIAPPAPFRTDQPLPGKSIPSLLVSLSCSP